jgi:DnaJ-class molecular chaperone
MAQDFYQLLEVGNNASPEEIQKAYRRLARKYHPDLNPDDKSAQQKFKEIQNAYDVLNDPEKRRMYDQFGPDFQRMGGDPFAGGRGPSDFDQYYGSGPQSQPNEGFGFGSFEELLKQFGGGGAGWTGGRGRGQSAPAAAQGADLRTELAVPFQTAVLGGTTSLNVLRGGREETIKIKIPPGVTSGKKMRLRGQGDPGLRGGPNGDLIVLLHVAPHPHFRRNGNNLELSLPITLKEAIMGATVDVPTPNGTVALKIPPGSSGGRRLRVKGHGVLSSSGPPGDLYVELQIRLPEQLLDSEKRSVELLGAVDQLESMYREPVRSHIQW